MTASTSAAKKVLRAAAALAFWLIIWSILARKVGQELVLPSPYTVLTKLSELGRTLNFWLSAGQSLLNVFIGFVSGVVLGTLLAALTSVSRLLDTLLSPLIRVVRATPVASFIILALLWLGKSRVPAFSSALMVTPILWQSVTAAIRDTDSQLLEMAHMYKFGKLRTLKLIYIPSVRTQWNAACATSMGLAWKSGIAAEVICLMRPTIGYELYNAKIYLETPALFAWTAVVIILSLILENAFAWLIMKPRGRRKI
jgi:NitT/TauT family transport system permease protein